MDASPHVIIIGAGIVGISTAIWLQRGGHRVTVVDRLGPAGGASFGNAGVLAAASVVPVTVPGILAKAPAMLFGRDGPLFLRWGHVPRLVPFLARYLSHARVEAVERAAPALSLLLHDTAEQHAALAAGTGAEAFVEPGDYVFGYRDRAAFEADAFGWGMRRKHGHAFEPMERDAFAAYDPVLGSRFGFGVRCPDHGRVSDPGAYVKALAAHVEREGGRFVTAEVVDVALADGRATGIVTTDGPLEADHVVLTAGVRSGPLMKKLGLSIPMAAERGYHVEFLDPSIVPRSPTMVAAGKFVLSPMEGRLRAAGIVEFGGTDDGRSQAPLELLKRQTKRLLPDLEYSETREWMGHRPATADSLPVIGEAAAPNVWCGFGHQHIGLSGGPKTGRWLADFIAGRRPNADLAPFRADRFGKRVSGRLP